MLRYGVPSVGGEAVLFGLKVGQPVGPGAMPTALPMTRTISAMAITASANSRRVSSDELQRWAVELIGFLCIGAPSLEKFSGGITPSQVVSAALQHSAGRSIKQLHRQ